MQHDLSTATWRKSTRSGQEGNCVEVAFAGPNVVAARDSKDADGPVLVFNDEQWTKFIAGVRDGKLDR